MTESDIYQLAAPAFREDIYQEIKERWNALAKPLDGMGTFETLFCTIGAVQETADLKLRPRGLIILCADNGIVQEGVSQSGQEVTLAVAKNMGRRMSSACRMAKACSAEVLVADIGINSGEDIPGVQNRKVMRGTRDFLKEPAMTAEEVLQAVETGILLVKECREKGIRILATGEMGIGNTTTSAAVTAALLKLSADQVTGRGAGLDDAGLLRKRQVIEEGLRIHGFSPGPHAVQAPQARQPRKEAFEILRCLGGLDIAGLCGVFLGGALYKVPVIVDGLISLAAALCAERLLPGAGRSFLASHVGAEPAMAYGLKALGLHPVIRGNLKLGEGSGAVMLFPLLDMTEAVYRGSSSFGEIGVEPYTRYDQGAE